MNIALQQFPCARCQASRGSLESPCTECGWAPTELAVSVDSKPIAMLSKYQLIFRNLPYAILFFVVITYSITFLVAAGSHQFFELYFHNASNSWKPVEAHVASITPGNKSAEMVYEYVFEGNQYSNNKLLFVSDGTIADAEIIYARFKVGQQITVFVNPSKPSQAVAIRRKLSWGVFFRIVCEIVGGVLFIAWVTWISVRHFRKGMREAIQTT
jgi:hypothetical protein